MCMKLNGRAVLTAISLVCVFTVWVDVAHGQATDSRDQTQQEQDSRFPSLPYYTYGSGLGLTTPDSTFQFNIRFRMQNRASYERDGDEESIDAAIRRLRLRFDGFVRDPRFLYAIQLSFAPGDVGEIAPGENINIIRDAVFFYRPNRHWNIGFGQTKLPGNRQRVNSSGALQLTDRSINNARFTIDRDIGVQVHYFDEQTDRFSWNLKTAISTGNGRNWTRNDDAALAYTARLELMPLGAFQGNGTLFEGDLRREPAPRLLLAGTWHLNRDAMRTRGQTGSELFERRDLTSVFLDAMLKYQGWAFQSAWMARLADDPVTRSAADPAATRHVFAGHGFDYQLSYLLASDYEIIGRYSTQHPHSDIRELEPVRRQYSVGLTRYVWEHTMKLQGELTRTTIEPWQQPGRHQLYVRFQVEIGI